MSLLVSSTSAATRHVTPLSRGTFGSIQLTVTRTLATSVKVERDAYGSGPLYERRKAKKEESRELNSIRKPLRMIMFGKPGSGA